MKPGTLVYEKEPLLGFEKEANGLDLEIFNH